jgi:pSer/pThr/pTyr-binding forkhead associated (FHA) protein
MAARTILKCLNGQFAGREFTFERPARWLVGRLRECDLALSDTAVSRLHCLLKIDPPNIWVRDLESTNGTYINGKRIDKDNVRDDDNIGIAVEPAAPLHSGDQVQIGGVAFLVRTIPETDDTVAPIAMPRSS